MRAQDDHRAFWSYARADDRAEGGRISCLRTLVVEQVALVGEELPIFLDQDAIEWGRQWAPAIDGALDGATVLIAVLTPRYFRSPACRAELETFLRLAREGRRLAVLPIHYAEVEGLRPGTTSTDPLVLLAKQLHYLEWQHVAREDKHSAAHRSAVHNLAQRLVTLDRAARGDGTRPPGRGDPEVADTAELLAAVEQGLEDIEGHVTVVRGLAAELDRVARGRTAGTRFVDRIAGAGPFALDLNDPSVRAEAEARALLDAVSALDPAVTALAQTAPATEPAHAVAELLEALRATAGRADEALAAFEEISLTIADATTFSPETVGPNERLRICSDRSSQARTLLHGWISRLAGTAELGEGHTSPGVP